MDFGRSSQTRTRAWIAIVVWALAGAGFVATFFAGGGPGGFAGDSPRHMAGAGALAFGFFGYWAGLWVTRARRGSPPLTDERDAETTARANQIALIVVLLGVFSLAIGLWVAYEDRGQVPVGWMWFMAYASVILASLASPVAILVLDGRSGGHE